MSVAIKYILTLTGGSLGLRKSLQATLGARSPKDNLNERGIIYNHLYPPNSLSLKVCITIHGYKIRMAYNVLGRKFHLRAHKVAHKDLFRGEFF